jgi:hypothetical protein
MNLEGQKLQTAETIRSKRPTTIVVNPNQVTQCYFLLFTFYF